MVDMSATIIHHGHIRLLKKAKEYGKVIVGLTTDNEIKMKKGYIPELAFEHRKEILEAIKYVDEVVGVPWLLDESVLDKYNIDLLVHGDDNSNLINKDRLLIFPRTKGVCSSDIRQKSSEIFLNKQNNIYDRWNKIKKKLENNNIIYTKERNIYFLSVGKNIGFESYGKKQYFLRPVLVYKKLSKETFLGIPLTSQKKVGSYYFEFNYSDNKTSYAMLNQIRVFDTRRIKYLSGKMDIKTFVTLKNKMISFLTLPPQRYFIRLVSNTLI
jgi:cytidyltransferase-like protein